MGSNLWIADYFQIGRCKRGFVSSGYVQWLPWGLNDLPGWFLLLWLNLQLQNGSARTDPILAFVPRVGGGLLEDVWTESHRSFLIPAHSNLSRKNLQIQKREKKSTAQCTAYSDSGFVRSFVMNIGVRFATTGRTRTDRTQREPSRPRWKIKQRSFRSHEGLKPCAQVQFYNVDYFHK